MKKHTIYRQKPTSETCNWYRTMLHTIKLHAYLFIGVLLISATTAPASETGQNNTAAAPGLLTPAPITLAAAGAGHALLLDKSGALIAAGDNCYAQLASTNTAPQPFQRQILHISAPITNLAAGGGFSFIILKNGNALATGDNAFGQLGLNDNNNRTTWTTIPIHNIAAIAAGRSHSIFLLKNGAVLTAGRNTYGQLGFLDCIDRNTPKWITGNAKTIAAGDNTTLIILNDGSLWVTGKNDYGQLGDGTTDNIYKLKMLYPCSIKAVAAGVQHTIILKDNGSVWTCGGNFNGQLGDGTTTSRTTPVKIIDSDAIAIAAGRYHSLVLMRNGNLITFGRGFENQTGTAPNNSYNPQNILTNVKTIAAGGFVSYAIRNDNTLWGCGDATLTTNIPTNSIPTDSDNDGISDNNEINNNTDPNKYDSDNDGLSDADEITHNTNPNNPDSDGDGLSDLWEIQHNLDPLTPNTTTTDSDNDGLTLLQEAQAGTDPTLADTDGDGINDNNEINNNTDPTLADTDGDGLSDYEEINKNSDPNNPDSDNDGLLDGQENAGKTTYTLITDKNYTWHQAKDDAIARGGHLATISSQAEWDIIAAKIPSNDSEVWLGATDENQEGTWEWVTGEPWNFTKWVNWAPHNNDPTYNLDYLCSIGDQWRDLSGPARHYILEKEISTQADNPDSDGDGLLDGWEQRFGLDPLTPDTTTTDNDNDGLTLLQEAQAGTDPDNSDTDGDGIPDAWEINRNISPLTAANTLKDPDHDNINSLGEYIADTDPLDPLSCPRIAASRTNGTIRLQFKTSANRTYQIKQSTNLNANIWHKISPNNITGTGAQITITPTITNNPTFYQLNISIP